MHVPRNLDEWMNTAKKGNGEHMLATHKKFAHLPLYRVLPYSRQQRYQTNTVYRGLERMEIQSDDMDREISVRDFVLKTKEILDRNGRLTMHERMTVISVLLQSFMKVMPVDHRSIEERRLPTMLGDDDD